MTAPLTGGPAWPTPAGQPAAGHYVTPGMTLRDWVAGQALSGMLASEGPAGYYTAAVAAERAYEMADAMIAASGRTL